MITCHSSDLGKASDWSWRNWFQPIRSTTQSWVVTRHQYGISPVVFQTSFRGKISCGIGCFLRQEWWSMSGTVIDAQTTDKTRKTISFQLRSYLGLPYLLFVLLIKVFSSFCLTYDVSDSASSSSTQWTYALL